MIRAAMVALAVVLVLVSIPVYQAKASVIVGGIIGAVVDELWDWVADYVVDYVDRSYTAAALRVWLNFDEAMDAYSSSAEAVEQAYGDRVEEIRNGFGGTGISSSGGFIYRAPFRDFRSSAFNDAGLMSCFVRFPDEYTGFHDLSNQAWRDEAKYEADVRFVSDSLVINAVLSKPKYVNFNNLFTVFYHGNAPVAGAYRELGTKGASFEFLDTDGVVKRGILESVVGNPHFFARAAGQGFEYPYHFNSSTESSGLRGSASWRIIVPAYVEYEVIPADILVADSIGGLVGAPATRLGSIHNNYGYYAENGDLHVIENQQIVNETNNTWYNPVTNATNNFESWTYDYSDRSYTLNSGNSTTIITYGDEYVTIREGDTVTNIYYITQAAPENPGGPGGGGNNNGGGGGNNGSGDGSGDSGGQSWWDKVTDWIGGRFYDLLTLAGSLVLNLFKAIIDFIIGIFEKIVEGIGSFVNVILKIFDYFPSLFSGFTDFLSAVFPFMPPEFGIVLTFGVALLVLAAVIRKIVG